MGRKRSRYHSLPPRMAQKGTRFYYVCSGKPRKWICAFPDPSNEWDDYGLGRGERPPLIEAVCAAIEKHFSGQTVVAEPVRRKL